MTAADGQHAPAARRARFHWRIAATTYFIAMTIGLHWPRLELGTADAPAPSRIIHALAFAGLTVLIWNAGWFSRLWIMTITIVIWGAGNEVMQGVISVGRTSSVLDGIANVLGVLVASIWIAALSSHTAVGGPLNQMRIAQQRWVLHTLLARPRTWVILIVGAAPIGVALVVAWPQVMETWRAGWPAGIMVAAFCMWIGAVAGLLTRQWRACERQLRASKPCLHCGTSIGEQITFDDRRTETCPHCGETVHVGHWIEPIGPPPAMLRRLIAAPLIVCTALIMGIFALLSLAVAIHGYMVASGMDISAYLAFGRRSRELPGDFTLVVDSAIMLAIAAMGVRMYRKRLAAYHDAQSEHCRVCQHDLRATPKPGGVGRCGECGARFLRV